MIRLLFITLISSIVFSCSEEGNQSTNNASANRSSRVNAKGYGKVEKSLPEEAPITYELVDLKVVDEKCESKDIKYCSRVIYNYPVFKGATAEPVNKSIKRFLSELMGYGDPDPNADFDLKKNADRFVDAYYDLIKTAGSSANWVAEVTTVGHTYYKNHISVKLKVVFDMGKGIPSTYYRVLTFNLKTGEEVWLINHFMDGASFQVLAENTFRNHFGYAYEQNLNSKGFEFPMDSFVLPYNMALTSEGIELIYNAYEIKPSSNQPTTVLIPFEDLEPILDLETNYNVPI